MNGVVWAVIKREYLQRVRSRWFVIATVAAPLLFLGILLVPAWMSNQGGDRVQTLALVDETGVLAEALAPRLEDGGYEVTREDPGPGVVARLTERVQDGGLGGVMVLDQGTLLRGEALLTTREAPSAIRALSLRQAVVQAALQVRLGGEEEDVQALLRGGGVEMNVLSGSPRSFDDPGFAAAYVGAFILYMTLLFYAVAVMRSVLEEKTSRIVEVVISSMRPFELMLGKILGVGAVGLTQFAIWITAGVLIASMALPALVAARPEIFSMETMASAIPDLGFTLLFLAFFLGGYFIYSGIYAAVGAMCNTDEEAQQAQFPVVMLLVVPVIFVTGVIQDPTDTVSVVLSFVPFFTPILMFARAAVGGASSAEVAVSIVLMAATVLAVAWVAGRIYRVGILMAGKRPTLPELIRWVRQP